MKKLKDLHITNHLLSGKFVRHDSSSFSLPSQIEDFPKQSELVTLK